MNDEDEDLDDLEDDEEYLERKYSHPLTDEEIADPNKIVERLWYVRPETALRLLEQAGITLRPQWSDGIVRVWDWHELIWKVTEYRGPWIHPSWDGSFVIFRHPPGCCDTDFEIGRWCDDPDIVLPPGWEFSDPWWARHR